MPNFFKPSPDQHGADLWRGAIVPATVIALVGLIGGSFFKGKPGFWGALLACGTVILFLSIHLLISRITVNLDPIATMAIAMFSYFIKILVMGAFLLVISSLNSEASVSRTTFGICALAITTAWLAGEISAFRKLRFQLPLPPQK
jgi:ATP synthase protein I